MSNLAEDTAPYFGLPWLARNNSTSATPPPLHVYRAAQEDYIQRFYQLLDQWRAETLHSSFFQQKIEHPAFRQIVGIGRPAIPLILDELRINPSFLFFALQLITGDNPVPQHLRGNVRAAVDMWIEWGNRQAIT